MMTGNSSWENRTPVFAVRGRRLSRLTKEPYFCCSVVPTSILYHAHQIIASTFYKFLHYALISRQGFLHLFFTACRCSLFALCSGAYLTLRCIWISALWCTGILQDIGRPEAGGCHLCVSPHYSCEHLMQVPMIFFQILATCVSLAA